MANKWNIVYFSQGWLRDTKMNVEEVESQAHEVSWDPVPGASENFSQKTYWKYQVLSIFSRSKRSFWVTLVKNIPIFRKPLIIQGCGEGPFDPPIYTNFSSFPLGSLIFIKMQGTFPHPVKNPCFSYAIELKKKKPIQRGAFCASSCTL